MAAGPIVAHNRRPRVSALGPTPALPGRIHLRAPVNPSPDSWLSFPRTPPGPRGERARHQQPSPDHPRSEQAETVARLRRGLSRPGGDIGQGVCEVTVRAVTTTSQLSFAPGSTAETGSVVWIDAQRTLRGRGSQATLGRPGCRRLASEASDCLREMRDDFDRRAHAFPRSGPGVTRTPGAGVAAGCRKDIVFGDRLRTVWDWVESRP